MPQTLIPSSVGRSSEAKFKKRLAVMQNQEVSINVMVPRRGQAENPAVRTPSARRPSVAVPPRSPARFGDFHPFRQWLPWLVPAFVAANVVVFPVTMYVNNCPKNSASCVAKFLGRFAFQRLKENPLLGPSSFTLEKMGALDMSMVIQKHQRWRLITCVWLHAGVFHILSNMLSIVFIGIHLEQEFGFVKIGLLYVISGFGGSLLTSLFQSTGIFVGASGALFGLLGALLSELITNWTIYANKCASILTTLFIATVNLALGILPYLDNYAHVGGFISGFLLGFVFLIRPQFGFVSRKNTLPDSVVITAKPKHKTYQYVLWVISLILLVSGYTTGLVLLSRRTNLNDNCSWCHYLSCIPTSLWSCDSKEAYCETSQVGNWLNLACVASGRTGNFTINGDDPNQVKQLCSQLCA